MRFSQLSSSIKDAMSWAPCMIFIIKMEIENVQKDCLNSKIVQAWHYWLLVFESATSIALSLTWLAGLLRRLRSMKLQSEISTLNATAAGIPLCDGYGTPYIPSTMMHGSGTVALFNCGNFEAGNSAQSTRQNSRVCAITITTY